MAKSNIHEDCQDISRLQSDPTQAQQIDVLQVLRDLFELQLPNAAGSKMSKI